MAWPGGAPHALPDAAHPPRCAGLLCRRAIQTGNTARVMFVVVDDCRALPLFHLHTHRRRGTTAEMRCRPNTFIHHRVGPSFSQRLPAFVPFYLAKHREGVVIRTMPRRASSPSAETAMRAYHRDGAVLCNLCTARVRLFLVLPPSCQCLVLYSFPQVVGMRAWTYLIILPYERAGFAAIPRHTYLFPISQYPSPLLTQSSVCTIICMPQYCQRVLVPLSRSFFFFLYL
ncbi:hypothetical protein K431DRAFT_120085 [Polychaeton citri CBS 116435]|uniref:Uncharacterized protein n=1 Tax=Polychaeton citri CBS 116435 TaxID=1314669 RepID=A0A9P4Q739_9PEZI|nr:hypothetical protein K431DRAFT_120085 [Polychaeton citri CBS 116435]